MIDIHSKDFWLKTAQAFPRRLSIMAEFAKTIKIKWTTDVPTLQMTSVGQIYMKINPDFVLSRCRRYEHVAFLIIHEILHHVFWEQQQEIEKFMVERGIADPWLRNVIFDVIIHSVSYQLMPDVRYQTLPESLFYLVEFPYLLFYYKNRPSSIRLKRLIDAIYSPMGVDYGRIIDVITDYFKTDGGGGDDSGDGSGNGNEDNNEGGGSKNGNESNDSSDGGMLIGSHGDEQEKVSLPSEIFDEIDNGIKDSIDKYIENKKEELQKRVATGQISYEKAEEKMESISADAGYNKSIYTKLVERARKQYLLDQELKKKMLQTAVRVSILSKLKKHVTSWFGNEIYYRQSPNFRWKKRIIAEELDIFLPYDKFRRGRKGGKVVMFWDVSGSQFHVLDVMTRLVLEMREYVNDEIYLFSNKVVPSTLKKIEEGKIETTGGTDFDCVAQEIAKRNIKKAIIFTDGLASCSSENLSILQRCKIVTVYTERKHGAFPSRFSNATMVLRRTKR